MEEMDDTLKIFVILSDTVKVAWGCVTLCVCVCVCVCVCHNSLVEKCL